MEIYPTVCPGCNLGCGLYLREDSGELSVDFRKNSPVNAGKLCRFALRLSEYYSSVSTTTVDGRQANLEDAAGEVSRILLENKGSVVFLSAGNTTCEEHLALLKLAETLGGTVDTLAGAYQQLPPKTHPSLGVGIPFKELEAADHIVLFFDPYTQYPLLVRHLLKAKRRGAKITAVGYKQLSLADENISVFSDYASQLELGEQSLVLGELHLHSDPRLLASLLNLAGKSGARIMFLKPFVNATGVCLLSKHTRQRSLQQLMDAIDRGDVTVLYCLDTDLLEMVLRENEVRESLSKLKALIVQSGRSSSIIELATVVLSTPPLYRRKGVVVNVEGRLLNLGGDDATGVEVLSQIVAAVGGGEVSYESLHGEVLKKLGVERVDEHMVLSYKREEYGEIEAAAGVGADVSGAVMVTVFTPFTWSGLKDDDFVELSLDDARSIGLRRNGVVSLATGGGSVSRKFKISQTHRGVLLTSERLPIAEDVITAVKAERI
jgi:predicted molibdopterin-dependent oxidoreductase YjgC